MNALSLTLLVIASISFGVFFWKLAKKSQRVEMILALSIGLICATVGIILSDILYKPEDGLPDIDAEVVVSDLKSDSLYLKFQIRNVGNAPAYNIWYLAKIGENYNYSDSEFIKVLEPNGKKIMIHAPINAESNYNQRYLSPRLWIGYNMKIGKKESLLYKEFRFTITNIQTNREANPPNNAFNPIEIEDKSDLIKTILPDSVIFSMKKGSIYQVIQLNTFSKSVNVFNKSIDNKKAIWYNPYDTSMNFTYKINPDTLLNVKAKLYEKKKSLYILVFTWNENRISLQIDDKVKDSIPQIYLINKDLPNINESDLVLPIYRNYSINSLK